MAVAREGVKGLLVEPHFLQPLGDIPDLVRVSKLRRQLTRGVRREPELGRFGCGQEERLADRRQPTGPPPKQGAVDIDPQHLGVSHRLTQV
ncbi:hypothetical protein GCM10009872_12050 [Actinopolymorpha rutila]